MIHPTAVIEPGAQLGVGVTVGPFCHVGPNVILHDDVRLVSHVVVDGDSVIGGGAVLYPFCTVGLAPQDLKYKGEATRCEIGARTQIREHCTIHRGTVTGSGLTRVGSGCLLMAVVHVAHDCAIGDSVVIANNVVMGGHVTIGDGAVVGGAAAIHQFVRIGRGAMIGGVSGVEADVIPFGSVIGNRARLAGLNVIGLRRRGVDRARLLTLRAAVRTLFWGDGVLADRMGAVRAEFGDDDLVAEVLDFASAPSKRGLIRAGSDTEDAAI
ncbi:MAG: acyl-ACP--UDP-N-acetylglucosamine O-acyltransferase [Acetobacteraceae bacterium]|nr:acyl-ACP--UDP-N-acetylglucosamine O-acyltransferase [Acetobacteraceae bacterium]